MANSQQILLDSFAEGQVGTITAADMRTFVNAMYAENALLDDIIDNLLSTENKKTLSAAQGKVLNDLITDLQIEVTANTDAIAAGTTGSFNTSTETITVVNGIITDIVAI